MGMAEYKIIGIIQCRNGSKRLPSKSMLPLAGKPLIYRFIERVKKSGLLSEIVLATTTKDEDKVLCDIAEELGIKHFCGSENDLIDRIYECAMKHKADVIVRLCADNPLIEAEEIDRIIDAFLRYSVDGVMFSNTQNIQNNGYPDGLGCEVYSMALFKKMWETVKDPVIREHPHLYVNGNIKTIPCPEHLKGYSHAVLDVNTEEEYHKIKAIYDKFNHNSFHFSDYKELL